MASQSYIIAREDIIIDACTRAREGRPVDIHAARTAIAESVEAYGIETSQGGNRANSGLWGTLGVNVSVLGRFCYDLRDECQAAARALHVTMNHDAICDLLKTKPLSELNGEEMDSARDIAYSILRADYYRHVRIITGDIKSEIESSNIKDWEALTEYVHDSVDGSDRVIYTNKAQETLLVSDNSDAMFDEFGAEGMTSDSGINWAAMAFHAIEADVWAQLSAEGIDHDYWDNLESEEEEDTGSTDVQ